MKVMGLRNAAPSPAWPWGVAAVVAAVLLAGCGQKKESAATQTAARVNKSEITVHQINFALQQQRGLRPDQAEAAGRQVLERLIDQELALQKAEDLKIDRDPRVVQQLEAARREIIARAYLEKVGEAAPRPTADEVQQYYDGKPALFAQRRIYNLQEISIEAPADQVPALRERLAASATLADFLEHLKASDLRFSGTQAVRAAEQLPLASLDAFAGMKDGQALLVPSATGAQVVVLAGSRTQPVTLEQARPAIEQFLLNERRRKLVEDDLKALRAGARIDYVGAFAGGAAASAPAAGGSSPAGGLSAGEISKGLGLK